MAAHEVAGVNAALANPKADIEQLDELERELFAYRYATGELMTMGPAIDPVKATSERSEAVSRLDAHAHELLVAPSTGELLERLESNRDLLDEQHKMQLAVLQRDYAQAHNVPGELQSEFMHLQIEANAAWSELKAQGDWESFSPYIDKQVDVMKRIALAQAPDADPYDTWLGRFEQGTNREMYNKFFEEVKACVIPLLAKVVASPTQINTAPIEGNFDARRQWELADDIVDIEGLDRDALWTGATEHPYTGGPGIGFVAIASHVHEDDILKNVFSMLHEGGHALYEQNVNWDYRFTSLKGGTSFGVHESISRFFENYVGRSEAFAPTLLAALRKRFPGQFGRVTERQLYMAENAVVPGLIRIEADELTYPLHIIVRYEIEQALFAGEISAKDIPALWAEKYEQYLGVKPANATEGCMQDVHWSEGYFGYFPTYALGTALGAQYIHAMQEQGIDVYGLIAQGDLGPIKAWFKRNIWQWGRGKTLNEILSDSCHEAFSAHYFTDYLVEKYSQIYNLEK